MRIAALVLLLLLAGGGFFGGIAFLVAPDGSALGMNPAQLPSWLPVADYSPAGLFLVVAFGVLPLAVAALLLLRRPEAWPSVLGLGALLIVWVVAQLLIVGLLAPPVQLTFLAIGLALCALGAVGVLRPPVPRS